MLNKTKETAKKMNMSETWLEKGRVYGYGPAFIKVGNSVRYDDADIDAYLASRRFTNTTEVDAALPLEQREISSSSEFKLGQAISNHTLPVEKNGGEVKHDQ